MDTLKEDKGKKLLRQAWEYGQRLDRLSRACKHPLDLFGSELQTMRTKLRDKCYQVLLLATSHCCKAEELLWKKSVYDLIQRCKLNKEALDGSSPLFLSYRNHLESCITYYCKLLERLDEQNTDQMSSVKAARTEVQCLKDLHYQCFVHLGDLARYQIAVGGNHFTAVAYYHHAIALDPSKGTSYNQLAALAGNKNENLDAVYYYQRSITSAQPFQGSQTNLARIYEKNQKTLKHLEEELERTTELDIREFTRELLMVRFLRLQHILHPSEGSVSGVTSEKILGKLCEDILISFEDCLVYDLALLKDIAPRRVTAALRGDDPAPDAFDQAELASCLPHDLLLKICALAILSSHTLRSLGSTYTPAATTFALSLFSQLLDYSYKHLSLLLHSVLSLASKSVNNVAKIEQTIEQGESMIDVLLRNKVDVSDFSTNSTALAQGSSRSKVKAPTAIDTLITKKGKSPPQRKNDAHKHHKESKKIPKKRLPKVVNRRRRRRRDDSDSSSEEYESCSSDSDAKSATSDESLSLLTETLGEDDLEMLDSLSDSSSSCEENTASPVKGQTASPNQSPPKSSLTASSKDPLFTGSPSSKQHKGGRRQIVLAASFNLAPSTQTEKKMETSQMNASQTETKSGQKVVSAIEDLRISSDKTKETGKPPFFEAAQPPASVATGPLSHVDTAAVSGALSLQQLMKETNYQSLLHTVCCLVAEESSLMSLRVFMEWLQSYPIVVAACSQSSSAIWSRLAALLNFLPTEDQMKCLDVGGDIKRQLALLEDVALRGFSPLLGFHESLIYDSGEVLTKTKQVAMRLCFFQKFGRFVADIRTVPSFSWDRQTQKFVGPAQKLWMDEKRAKEKENEQEKQAQVHRSKLMNAMAQQRLQHEVASLEVTANKQETVFTPYLIPDASSLCTGLHIVKKLLATEKFIFVIAKSVIETLDGMKKGRDNFTSREVIKFLEKELKGGNKFIKAQKAEETVTPNARKPSKMDVDTWHFTSLIDCAIYYNQTYGEKGQEKAVVTILLDQKLMKAMDGSEQSSSEVEIVRVVQSAWQHGLDFDSVLGFYSTWKAKDSSKRKQ